jgi:SsrA-binding protein
MPTILVNKPVRFDYDILETLEAGIVLSGGEVKSLRTGHGKITGAFITFRGSSAYLTNASIPKYPFATDPGYEPDRSRKILLKKKQVDFLRGRAEADGLTVVPLSVYTHGPLLKLEIGLARGKKKYDKRASIKKKDVQKEMQRNLKNSK